MTNRNEEPERLSRGKKFHDKVQKEWLAEAEGEINEERPVVKPSGRKGRVDVFVETEGGMVAIAEIKDSDWDAMTGKNLRRNVRRQIRQVWSYIESQLELGHEVSPGIIFSRRPSDPDRLRLIESLFEEEGIPVVWDDESIEERRAR